MLPNMRRILVRIQFALNTIQYQMMYYILGNSLIRRHILKLLKPYPKLENFLRQNAVGIRQEFVKKRILYQRSIHPTMVIQARRQASPIRPESLIQVEADPRSVVAILRQIDIELR